MKVLCLLGFISLTFSMSSIAQERDPELKLKGKCHWGPGETNIPKGIPFLYVYQSDDGIFVKYGQAESDDVLDSKADQLGQDLQVTGAKLEGINLRWLQPNPLNLEKLDSCSVGVYPDSFGKIFASLGHCNLSNEAYPICYFEQLSH